MNTTDYRNPDYHPGYVPPHPHTDDYKSSNGQKMYRFSVTVSREHYEQAQWMGWYLSEKTTVFPPLDFLKRTGRYTSEGDIVNLGDRQWKYEIITGHPLAIALRGILPHPGAMKEFILPDFNNIETQERFWLSGESIYVGGIWDNTDWLDRPHLPPMTITMIIREESVLRHKLHLLDLPHIKLEEVKPWDGAMKYVRMIGNVIKKMRRSNSRSRVGDEAAVEMNIGPSQRYISY